MKKTLLPVCLLRIASLKAWLFAGLAFLTFNNQAQTVTDYDGNVYDTIHIGTQAWLKQNLKVKHYRNGDSIGTTFPVTLDISGESAPKYQWAAYGIDSNATFYGRLYTWYAITDSRNVCPTGWHVPSDTEWTTLTDYLTNNGYGYQGSGNDIVKSMVAKWGWGTNTTPGTPGYDTASNNSSGFTALPGGFRGGNGTFFGVYFCAAWWSSTEYNNTDTAYNRHIFPMDSIVQRLACFTKDYGIYVRCLSDSLVTQINENSIDKHIQIYPNPAIDKVYINYSEKGNVILQVCNTLGECVLQRELSSGTNVIDIGFLPKGIYIIQLIREDKTIQQKLIKE